MISSNTTVKKIEEYLVRSWMAFQNIFSLQKQVVPPSKPKNILLTKTCCMGDAIISLSAIKAYKKANPHTIIDVLCSQRIESVYKSISDIHQIYTLPISGRNLLLECLNPRFLWKFFTFLKIIKKKK
ncbi:MAG: hypothetical protein HQK83_12305, partial [Fibrobacteria bacterium]|nr:hypothetical protein [Fibrobacteria bacterium]